MKVSIENTGEHPIRIIVDHDTINDFVLDPGASDSYQAEDEGVIELREMEGTGEAEDEAHVEAHG